MKSRIVSVSSARRGTGTRRRRVAVNRFALWQRGEPASAAALVSLVRLLARQRLPRG